MSNKVLTTLLTGAIAPKVSTPQSDTMEMTGSVGIPKRQQGWQTKRVFFLTPQVCDVGHRKGEKIKRGEGDRNFFPIISAAVYPASKLIAELRLFNSIR